MRSKALRICLAGDLLAFMLTFCSYLIVDYYERLESQTHGFYLWPGLLFLFWFAISVAAFLTTLFVVLFWPSEPAEVGTGLSQGR